MLVAVRPGGGCGGLSASPRVGTSQHKKQLLQDLARPVDQSAPPHELACQVATVDSIWAPQKAKVHLSGLPGNGGGGPKAVHTA